jgi:putative oxidoreductase
LILRLFPGLFLAFGHGINKLPVSGRFIEGVAELGFPLPVVFAWAAALSEFAGGLLVAAGLFTRPAALFVFVTMMVAGFGRHAADPYSVKEKALLFAVIGLAVVFVGAGKYALDYTLRRKKRH